MLSSDPKFVAERAAHGNSEAPLKISRFNLDKMRHLIVGVAAILCSIDHSGGIAAEQKKSAPAPAQPRAAAPTAHAPSGTAGAAGAAHGPTTSTAHGPTTATTHGPTTSTAHGVTTATAHGPTTGGAAGHTVTATSAGHGVSTSSPGGTKTNAGTAGGYKPGTPAHPGGSSNMGHPASAFGGHPAAANTHELHAANGAAIRTRADGSRSDVHDPARGMDIHHGLNGGRRISVERPDHSRIVAERGGRGYVQHPYTFHGREFGHRTYFEHGRAYDRFYGRAGWHGRYYDVYAPARYYPHGFYGYAYAPWPAPVPYAWAPAPWYGPYGYYYAYYPVYPAPAFWLTDFIFAASLAAAYEAGHSAGAAGAFVAPELFRLPTLREISGRALDFLISPADAAAIAPPLLTPEIKQQVSEEIKSLVQQEGNESQANAKQDADPAADSVMKLLGDNHPHVFVAGGDLDLVSSSGNECAISQGDVVRVAVPPAGDADSVAAAVLASKGNKECPANSNVTIALSDLQDMHNHMRESIDDGLAELQKKQGSNGLPAAPPDAAGPAMPAGFAKDAPPPDSNAGDEVAQQAKDADATEQDVARSVTSGPATNPEPGSPVNISIGQPINTVTAALGNPLRIIDLGAKKIYTYQDMKVIFMNGKVSDVQ